MLVLGMCFFLFGGMYHQEQFNDEVVGRRERQQGQQRPALHELHRCRPPSITLWRPILQRPTPWHWKGKFGLHWHLVNAPGKMAEQLGRRELETKRMEDARRLALEDPRYRSERELADIRNYTVTASASCRVVRCRTSGRSSRGAAWGR